MKYAYNWIERTPNNAMYMTSARCRQFPHTSSRIGLLPCRGSLHVVRSGQKLVIAGVLQLLKGMAYFRFLWYNYK